MEVNIVDITGKTVKIVAESDPYNKKTGRIIKVIDEAFYNLVVEFPNGKVQLYRNEELKIID